MYYSSVCQAADDHCKHVFVYENSQWSNIDITP